MKIHIPIELYSEITVLKAVRKQQLFADWKLAEKLAGAYVISCETIHEGISESTCQQYFWEQLGDEVIREKLESEFSEVRNWLVKQAFAPIIGND